MIDLRKHYTDQELIEGWLKERFVSQKDIDKYRKRTGKKW